MALPQERLLGRVDLPVTTEDYDRHGGNCWEYACAASFIPVMGQVRPPTVPVEALLPRPQKETDSEIDLCGCNEVKTKPWVPNPFCLAFLKIGEIWRQMWTQRQKSGRCLSKPRNTGRGQQPPEARQGRGAPRSQSRGRNLPCPHLDLTLPASRSRTRCPLCCFRGLVCTWLQQL